MMKLRSAFAILFSFIAYTAAAQTSPANVSVTLSGINFLFDGSTGGILRMSHAATGVMLQSAQNTAGLVDIALPVKEFEPLRLAPRFSKSVKITRGKNMVTLYWSELGASRSFTKYDGKVSVTVVLKELPDRKSISLTCRVENHSDKKIPQVVFPDLEGFLPFDGKSGTEFRTGGTAIKPFVDLVVNDHDDFYATNTSTRWFHYGFVLDGKNLVIKWMDIGGRHSGLSIFSKDWGQNAGYNEGVFLRLSEKTRKLRYMKTLNQDIRPGASWESPEYILTPHANGWAEGIKPYREWANQNIKRLYPCPDHVRDGLGYRSIWMKTSFYAEDPQGINFKFTDLPKVAKESKDHGLGELNLWGWYENLWLPLPAPWKYLGTEEDLSKSVAECKKIGVNVSPFITVMKANATTGKKYNLPPNNSNYNYDPEFIPQMNPGFASAGNGSMVVQSNKQWQQDVYASTEHLIKTGITSSCWDQFFSDGTDRSLDTVVTQVLKMQKAADPQSTFSGEAGTNMEYECDYLDYTWNWDYDDKCDYRPLINALRGPRINLNIDRSAAEAKVGFADNLYLNVWTRKPDAINGSDYISNHSELSDALKQCARLRKQFLNFFVNGTFIADCILEKDCEGAHISTYTLDKRMLVIVLNQDKKRQVNVQADIAPWLKSASGRYRVKEYNDGAEPKTSTVTGARWNQKTPLLDNLGICIYEVSAE